MLWHRDPDLQNFTPLQVAIMKMVPHETVLLLVPASTPALWSGGSADMGVHPLKFVERLLFSPDLIHNTHMIRYCQDLHPKLVARR